MKAFRTWHLFLIPIPIVGWFLLVAYALDEWQQGEAAATQKELLVDGRQPLLRRGRRLAAGAVDFLPLIVCAAILPPTWAWILGSSFLLFRDAGSHPFGWGKRVLGLSVLEEGQRPLGYTESFARNLPLLVPYLGPLVEAILVLMNSRRLGDRLVGTRVF